MSKIINDHAKIGLISTVILLATANPLALAIGIIEGGNLAVYYATHFIGKACKLKTHKVLYIQFAALALFNVAAVATFTAVGILSIGPIIGLTAINSKSFVLPSYRNARRENARREHDVVINEWINRNFPLLDRPVYRQRRHFFTVNDLQQALNHSPEEIFVRLWENERRRERGFNQQIEIATERSQNDYRPNRVSDCIDFANLYYKHQIAARDILMDPNNGGLSVYSKEDIEEMGESLESVCRLAIFNLIDSIKKTSRNKIVFKQVGKYEFDPDLDKECFNFFEGLFKKLKKLKKDIHSLTKQDLRWKIILQKQLTSASLEKEEWINESSVAEQKMKCDSIFKAISQLYRAFDKVTTANTGIQWMDVFVLENSKK